MVCYYCGGPATTSEHVPPKCLFPESKDALGVDYRKSLITVPSCEEHNSAKSKDDEFLMASITANLWNNEVAYTQIGTKLRRALVRNGGRLMGSVLSEARQFVIKTADGIRFPVLVGRPDVVRLRRVLEHVARGLYLHTTGKRFVGTCHVFPGFIQFPRRSDQSTIKWVLELWVAQERTSWATRGENPEVFYFQVGPVDQFGLIPMVMTFFRGSDVLIAFQPEGVDVPFRFRP